VIAAADLSAELAETVLWRHDVVRVCCADPRQGLATAWSMQPDLVVLGALPTRTTLTLLRRLRRHESTRGVPVVVLYRALTESGRRAFEVAGAEAVWTFPVDPRRWDGLIQELTGLPVRRSLRTPVRLSVWSAGPREGVAGLALDLSTGGMLLDAPSRLVVGSNVDVVFALPNDPREIHALARVVRQASAESLAVPGMGEASGRYGLEFLALAPEARARIAAFVEGRRRAWLADPAAAS
jgi:CheY-like chemotaxis protein